MCIGPSWPSMILAYALCRKEREILKEEGTFIGINGALNSLLFSARRRKTTEKKIATAAAATTTTTTQ